MNKIVLQVALDFVDLPRALKLAKESVDAGIDWLEAGTPLIKSAGINCITQLRKEFPNTTIVADMKTMDVGRIEVEMAAKSGANIVGVLAAASDSTIKECVEAGKNYGAKIIADLIEVEDVINRAREVEKLGVDYVGIHIPIDEQMRGQIAFDKVTEIVKLVSIPVSVAGGINSENVHQAVSAGASIIVVGGAITKSTDVKKAVANIKLAIDKKLKIETDLFRRVDEKDVREIFGQVSTANISDAMHRKPALPGLVSITPGLKIVGTVITVKTYPGDWAKPVEAIDSANPGDVIVIDAGGVGPAVWGELATQSAIQRRIAGVVIDGAIRDVTEIRQLKFPAVARLVMSNAGEPKGFGEIGIPINIGGEKVFTGDWVVGDDDGIMVIPQKKVVEVANRAMDVLEKENRIRKEIQEGGTLGKVTDLLRWEKK